MQDFASKNFNDEFKLNIIIPCYNEKETIEIIIDAVIKSPVTYKEIIIVDDYSTDGTREILENKFKNKIDKLIYLMLKGKRSTGRMVLELFIVF